MLTRATRMGRADQRIDQDTRTSFGAACVDPHHLFIDGAAGAGAIRDP